MHAHVELEVVSGDAAKRAGDATETLRRGAEEAVNELGRLSGTVYYLASFEEGNSQAVA